MQKLEVKDLRKDLVGQTISINGILEWKEQTTADESLYLKISIDDGTGRIYASVFPQNPLVKTLLDIPQMKRVLIVGKLGKVATTPRTANFFESIESIEIVNLNKNGNIDIKKVQDALRSEYKKIADPALRKLVTNCIKNVPNIFEAPFSDNHYAYQGGLAHYILRCLRLAESTAKSLSTDECIVDARMNIAYDMDVVRTGIFLHRIGKTVTYHFDDNGVAFKTLSGLMNGDVLETIRIVSKEMDKVDVSEEKKMQIEHLISSSKKLQIWGAITEPKTKEAHFVHYIEQLVLNHSQYEALNVDGNNKDGELAKGAFNKRYYVKTR